MIVYIKIFVMLLATCLTGSCASHEDRTVDLQTYNSFSSCWRTEDVRRGSFSAFLVLHSYGERKRIAEAFSTKCRLRGLKFPEVSARFIIGFDSYIPNPNEIKYFGEKLISNRTSHISSDPLSIVYVEGISSHFYYGAYKQLVIKPEKFTTIRKIDQDPDLFIKEHLGVASAK